LTSKPQLRELVQQLIYKCFDFVTSISAIEHIGYYKYNMRLPLYNTFLEDSKVAVREMCRVIKKGGYLYITSDMFIPNIQITDRGNPGRDLGEAYKINDLKEIFLNTLNKNEIKTICNPQLDVKIVLENGDRSNYRGRYFSTFAIFGIKN